MMIVTPDAEAADSCFSCWILQIHFLETSFLVRACKLRKALAVWMRHDSTWSGLLLLLLLVYRLLDSSTSAKVLDMQ
jgi:hypothetical protein